MIFSTLLWCSFWIFWSADRVSAFIIKRSLPTVPRLATQTSIIEEQQSYEGLFRGGLACEITISIGCPLSH